jgi:PKD repeat protein
MRAPESSTWQRNAVLTSHRRSCRGRAGSGPDATVESNELFSFSGTFSDPGILDAPWTWAIDWGDGETTNGSTNNQALPIVASHAFCASDYTVTLTVTDKDGGSGFDTMTVTVEHIAIPIIIRPSASPNPISPRTRGVIPVAVLSTADFDATTIDPATATLGDGTGPGTGGIQRPNGTLMVSVEDVDGDGLNDLVLHFSIPELIENGDLSETTTELHLEAFLADGCSNVRGTDESSVPLIHGWAAEAAVGSHDTAVFFGCAGASPAYAALAAGQGSVLLGKHRAPARPCPPARRSCLPPPSPAQPTHAPYHAGPSATNLPNHELTERYSMLGRVLRHQVLRRCFRQPQLAAPMAEQSRGR